jgi:pimeloyl-ACP methyl ester carboxylesterase
VVGGAGILGLTILGSFATPTVAQTGCKTFVLVHGAWGAGWLWRRVADRLTAKGHKVFTPTMTGVGERSHLLDANIRLATHITDIVNVIKWERLTDIVLVGHSYGGVVVSGVAELAEPTISSIVYLDAFVPENGQSLVDLTASLPTSSATAVAAASQKGEIALKPMLSAFLRVKEKDHDWVDSLSTPQPLATFTDKVVVTGARDRIAKRTYIRGKDYPNVVFDRHESQLANTAGWHVHELPCGHMVMVDMPDELTELLLAAA